MARIVQTASFDLMGRDSPLHTDPNFKLWAYNGLDCCVTRGVHDALAPQVAEKAAISYKFVRAMQGPALDMMMRGIAIQPKVKQDETNRLLAIREKQQALLDKLAEAVWGRGLNPNSPKQMTAFFYDALKMTKHYSIRKTPQGKIKSLSCDHKALEALAKEQYKGPGINPYDRNWTKVSYAQPFVSLITTLRDTDKKLGVVRSRLSSDGRFRFGYNVVGTITGRWSSSTNAFGEGNNGQNITEYMRRMFCADDGMKMASPDLEQAESRVVAALAWAATGIDFYWKACEAGDLHTIVCMMTEPEKDWQARFDTVTGEFTGDKKHARHIADIKYYRHLSFRDVSKRTGHGSNYWGPPYGIAMQVGIPVGLVTNFQKRYFGAFPEIPKWHAHTIKEVQTTGQLTTPLGRTRHFFGRTNEDSVLREAIAHVPQSTIGELLNYMLYRVWHHGIENPTFRNLVQLLFQVHDSIGFQYPDDPYIEWLVLSTINDLMQVDIPIYCALTGETRILRIPLEFKTGWNWARNDPSREMFSDGNPDGFAKWRGSDGRRRVQRAKPSLNDWLA